MPHHVHEPGHSLTVVPGPALVGDVGLIGDSTLPGDKSLSHRAVLFAALAEGESVIENFLVSGVTQPMLEALRLLEIPWWLEETTLRVQGVGLQPKYASRFPAPLTIDCRNSATTLRLLAGALAAWGIPAVLDGSPSLRRRPMLRIVEPLQQMGVDIQATHACSPLILQTSRLPLRAIHYSLPVASAQVKSCLLLASLAADAPATLIEPGPSRDHTERMLCAMGVKVVRHQSLFNGHFVTCLTPPSPKILTPLHTTLAGDLSAAAFLIVAALITSGSQITLSNVGLNPTRTGLLDVLRAMGADLRVMNQVERDGEPVGDLLVRHSCLHGVKVSGDLVVRMIDEFPVFAVAASYAEGTTVVENAQELRHKESDRISALGTELQALGVQLSETEDGFIIQGGRPLKGGIVYPHGDHRLAMSLAIAGLASHSPVTVQEAQVISESFPGFVSVLRTLGAQVTLHET